MNRVQAFLFLGRCLARPMGPGPQTQTLREELTSGGVDWPKVIELASRHYVTPALYWALQEKGLLEALPDDLLEYLSAMHDLNRERNLRLVKQTGDIAGLLNKSGVEPLVLKGVGNLLAGLYGDPAVRFIGDLDILVPQDRLRDCVDALMAAGYAPVAGAEPIADSHMAAYCHFTGLVCKGQAAPVDVHWAVIYPEDRYLLPPDEVRNEAKMIVLEGSKVRVPGALHRAVTSIAHAQLRHWAHWAGQVRMRDLYDLFLLTGETRAGVDWPRIVEKFRRAGYGNALRTALMMAERLFGLPMPDKVGPPFAARWRWYRAMMLVKYPWLHAPSLAVAQEIGYVRSAFTDTAMGRLRREKLMTPKWYIRHVKALIKRLRGAKSPPS